MAKKTPFSWKSRKFLWNALVTAKYRGNKPSTIPEPRDSSRLIRLVPIKSMYPEIDIDGIFVADHIPKEEKSRLKRFVVDIQLALNARFSQMQAGLPPISEDPHEALSEALTPKHTALFPVPVRPPEFDQPDFADILGAMAVQGPLAGCLENGENGLAWELLHLNDYEHHSELSKIGTRVVFDLVPQSKRLSAVEIKNERGVFKPGDNGWKEAARTALCAASTYTSLVRHYNWVHLVSGGPIAVATRNQLPDDHVIRRLLWPHIYGTQFSNDIATEPQLRPDGDFVEIFSLTARGVYNLFADSVKDFRITQLSPPADARRRNIDDTRFDLPNQKNMEELFHVILAHTKRYVEAYFPSDDDVAMDPRLSFWLKEVDRLTPGGIREITSDPATINGVANIAASIIYLGCVQHELLGTHCWDYQLWTDIIPPRIYENGNREPLDIYQRLVNANFTLNVRRARLMEDYAYLAIDEKGVRLFREFLTELQTLDVEMEALPPACWRIRPSKLEANINA